VLALFLIIAAIWLSITLLLGGGFK